MDRRTVLASLLALAGTQVACQSRAAETVRIAVLKHSIPSQVLAPLEAALSDTVSVKVDTQATMTALFQQLQQWQSSDPPTAPAAWVSLSDYWLQAAIEQQLISPLAIDAFPRWSEVPDRWHQLLKRDPQGFPAAQGRVWATPYRWGELVMVYSRRQFERLGWQPTAWSDLWRPDLARRIILPNHPRLTLGLALKALGESANDPNPSRNAAVVDAINTLRPQVKRYTSDDYGQSLIQGDIWLAVGWSTDVRPILAQYRQLRAVVPTPGTLLSADVWVKPRQNQASDTAIALTDLDRQWTSHWWQPDTQTPMSLFSGGLSPRLIASETLAQASDLNDSQVLLPTVAQLQQSEFLQPLSQSAIADYTSLWRTLRGSE